MNPQPPFHFAALGDWLKHEYPKADTLLGVDGAALAVVGGLVTIEGDDGSGKSTLAIDLGVHLAAGEDWLGITVPRPVRILVIENEGPPGLFQSKLMRKGQGWEGPRWSDNVHVFATPWGDFSFADATARAELTRYCDEHGIEMVIANPTLGLGAAGSGKPNETQAFVDWLVECGLKSTRAFTLVHHNNKAGQVSGDWGRHADTRIRLERDGDKPRTKLDWAKTRWASIPTAEFPKKWWLEWADNEGYKPIEVDTVGASDSELLARIDEFLRDNPGATTSAIEQGVSGTATRIRKLLKAGDFDSYEGKRRSTCWMPRANGGPQEQLGV